MRWGLHINLFSLLLLALAGRWRRCVALRHSRRSAPHLPPAPPASAAALQGAETAKYAHEAGYDAYMTGAAFGCLARLYEAAAAGAGGQTAPPPGQQPGLGAVGDFCWRMNISRWEREASPNAGQKWWRPAAAPVHATWHAS